MIFRAELSLRCSCGGSVTALVVGARAHRWIAGVRREFFDHHRGHGTVR